LPTPKMRVRADTSRPDCRRKKPGSGSTPLQLHLHHRADLDGPPDPEHRAPHRKLDGMRLVLRLHDGEAADENLLGEG
jgi:hypothetical protein